MAAHKTPDNVLTSTAVPLRRDWKVAVGEVTEGMPPTPDEGRQLIRSLTEKVLDKVCSDPTWKQQLLEDPEAAFRAANFPEYKRLEEMRRSVLASLEGAEVRGHFDFVYDLSSSSSLDPGESTTRAGSCIKGCYQTCYFTYKVYTEY